MDMNFYKTLCDINGEDAVMRDEPMSRHTTFRIGGPARYFCRPTDEDQISRTIRVCLECGIPYYVIGNGSNILVNDAGYDGVIIQLFRNRDEIRVDGCRMETQSGALLSRIASLAAHESLAGLEFASGIPGTLGGALTMNAGAYGGEMKDVVSEAILMRPNGEIATLSVDELELGYRTSIIAREGYVVLGATLALEKGDPSVIEARMKELREARTAKQPLEYPSAGSTFKRPTGYFAGKLIMDAGLRGYRVGGAQVSEKHCGFVVNTGGATARDVLALIAHIQDEVRRQFGVELEMEVKTLGF